MRILFQSQRKLFKPEWSLMTNANPTEEVQFCSQKMETRRWTIISNTDPDLPVPVARLVSK